MDVTVLLATGDTAVFRDGTTRADDEILFAVHEGVTVDSETLEITRIIYQARFMSGSQCRVVKLERTLIAAYGPDEWVEYAESAAE